MDVLGFIVPPYGLHFLASLFPHPTHFEPVPAPGCNWWHTGAGRLMPRRKDNRHSTDHISKTGPTPRTASRKNSSFTDGSGRLWFKHLHGWNTCTALQIHGMQQVSGERLLRAPEWKQTTSDLNRVYVPIISKEQISWRSNKYKHFTPAGYTVV